MGATSCGVSSKIQERFFKVTENTLEYYKLESNGRKPKSSRQEFLPIVAEGAAKIIWYAKSGEELILWCGPQINSVVGMTRIIAEAPISKKNDGDYEFTTKGVNWAQRLSFNASNCGTRGDWLQALKDECRTL